MGAWGYSPLQSDNFYDTKSFIGAKVDDFLIEKRKYGLRMMEIGRYFDHYTYAGLVIDSLKNGYWISYKNVYFATWCLEEEVRNTKYGNKMGWSKPNKLIKIATELADSLQEELDEVKNRCFKIYKPKRKKGSKKSNKEWAMRRVNKSKIFLLKTTRIYQIINKIN